MWRNVEGQAFKVLCLWDGLRWVPCYATKHYVPDHLIGNSKGFATMQALLKQGWTLEKSE